MKAKVAWLILLASIALFAVPAEAGPSQILKGVASAAKKCAPEAAKGGAYAAKKATKGNDGSKSKKVELWCAALAVLTIYIFHLFGKRDQAALDQATGVAKKKAKEQVSRKLADGAFWLGIFSFCPFLNLIFAPAALIVGIMAIRDIHAHPEKIGLSRAWAGVVLGGLIALATVIFIVVVNRV